MNIVERKISEITPYENNPRRNDDAVPLVANSIKEFGFKQPIVIDKDGVIVAGHTRYLAAKKLKLKTVPCVIADDLTEEQVKAYRLADNKVSEAAEWDFELLDKELNGILDIDMEDFGFFDFEIPELAEEKPEIIEDDYDGELPQQPKTKSGDIYALGEHRLMCGDTSNAPALTEFLGGVKADMVFTDPPYGVSIGDKNKALNAIQRSGRQTENIENDTLSEEELYELLKTAFINIRENCADDACYYVTSPQGGSLGLMMMMMMRDAGLEVRHILMWEKNSATFSIGRLDYDYQHEPIFYTWTKTHHNYRNGENRTTVWKYPKPRKCDLHPTMKPVELIANAIMDGTEEGMKVLDGFGGSGSTLIACEQTNRVCYMVELDPKYCDVIIDRWEQFTGKKAVLINGDR